MLYIHFMALKLHLQSKLTVLKVKKFIRIRKDLKKLLYSVDIFWKIRIFLLYGGEGNIAKECLKNESSFNEKYEQ